MKRLINIGSALVCACVAIALMPSCSQTAKINDVSVPIALDSGYRVVAVSGKKPERSSSSFVTVVPYVEVHPGKHLIEIEPKDGYGERKSFYFSPSAGTVYRIGTTENGFTLIEDAR
jgi:hypothetical protein